MARLSASDLHDELLRPRVKAEHLAELDEWIESEADADGIAAESIQTPLVGRALRAARYRLGVIVCLAMSGQNQGAMNDGQDVYSAKLRLYQAQLDDVRPNLTAVDWSGVADAAAAPNISFEIERA
jgi:hypothetical protein